MLIKKLIGYFIKTMPSKPTPGIKIIGPEWFQQRINLALKILKEKDIESFDIVNQYLDKVVYDEYLNLKVFAGVSSLGAREAFFGKHVKNCIIYFLIGALYQEAYYCKLDYEEGQIYSGKKRKVSTFNAARNMLVKINAPLKSIHQIDLFLSDSNWWSKFPSSNDWVIGG